VKGMEYRVVPMTRRLRESLARHKHLKGDRVLYTDAGETATAKVIQKWMARVQKRAGLRATGAMHLLRHTFCSHLAMKGAPALSIQRLAGHKNLQTTLRYMHRPHARRACPGLRGGAGRAGGGRNSGHWAWRHSGDGPSASNKAEGCRVVRWWRRRESNPGPEERRDGYLRA
jgi:hypothetical protein